MKEINKKVYKAQETDNIEMLPGDHSRLPDEFFYNTLIFIDAGFLSKLSKHFGNGRYIPFKIIPFAKKICEKEKMKSKDIFYYTAPPFQSFKPNSLEIKKKENYDNFQDALIKEGVIFREGRCQRLKINGEFKYGQKAVDVYLAMDLTNVLIKYPKVKRIILISSDSDFVPVIKNLEVNGVKTVLYTYYEKKRNTNFSRSNHLIKSVYKYKLLCKEDFERAQLIKLKGEKQ